MLKEKSAHWVKKFDYHYIFGLLYNYIDISYKNTCNLYFIEYVKFGSRLHSFNLKFVHFFNTIKIYIFK